MQNRFIHSPIFVCAFELLQWEHNTHATIATTIVATIATAIATTIAKTIANAIA